MSAIQKELCKACDIDPSKYKDTPDERAALHADIVKAVNKFNDNEWNKLSVGAQDWFNAAADATKAKKDLAEFPDMKSPEPEPESRSRRRSSEDDKPAKGESMAVEKLQDGDRVKLTTKRGKVYEGEVVEQNKRKEFVAVKGGDGEDEIDWKNVDTVEVFHGNAGTSGEDAGPAVGDEVSFTTKRGKSVSGVISELTGETIVIGKDDDYDMSKIDGDIKIVKKGGGTKEEPETRRRGGSSSSKDKEEDKGSRSRGGTDGEGNKISVGGRIRELMADDPTREREAVEKIMTKEKIEFRPATLNIIYRDCQHFMDLLRKAGHMKKAA